jgi:hypothetical protein
VLENILSRFLAEDNIDIHDTDGQGSGNDLNMKGKNNGLQKKITFKSKGVLYSLYSSQLEPDCKRST